MRKDNINHYVTSFDYDKHKVGELRIREREEAQIRLNHDEAKEGKTFNQMKADRRKEQMDFNTKTFASQPVGVHG
jgi:hypothetical protein